MQKTKLATKVGIIGGGFAGLNAAKILGRNGDVQVTLIDQRNHHLFQPLLYQVATAGLSPAEIAMPIRAILSEFANTDVVMDEIVRVEASTCSVFSRDREYHFDYLILACGATHSYFGKNQWEEFAPGLKTVEQATEIRRRVLLAFEEAEKVTDPELQRAYLTFVIVGGGPTGVELAGSIAELGKVTLTKDFRHIDSSRTRVLLIEAGSRVLAAFDPSLSDRAMHDLEDLGVQVWINSRVTDINAEGVAVGKDFIASRTVLWAAGVATSPLATEVPAVHDRAGRIEVQPDLSVPNYPHIFVLGDMASVKGEDGNPLPGLAPVAMQAGRAAARNILADLKGKPRQDFKYWDKGMMATVGRKKAVLQAGKIKMTGPLAWLAWLFIHVYYLIGFRNRFVVCMQWAWSYFTYKRGARLIVSKDWRMESSDPKRKLSTAQTNPNPSITVEQTTDAKTNGPKANS